MHMAGQEGESGTRSTWSTAPLPALNSLSILPPLSGKQCRQNKSHSQFLYDAEILLNGHNLETK